MKRKCEGGWARRWGREGFSSTREEGGRRRQVYETLLTDVETSSLSVEAAAEVCWRASRSRRAAHSTVALRNGAALSLVL